MKKTMIATLLIAVSGIGSGAARSDQTYATVPMNNAFGYALMKSVAKSALAVAPDGKTPNKNILLSPISAAMALQMLLNGAGPGSTTYGEIEKTLGIQNLNLDAVNRANQELLTQVQSAPAPAPSRNGEPASVPFTLKIANSAWSNSHSPFQFLDSFRTSLRSSYQAEANRADFAGADGLKAINDWASKNTDGKVSNVIDHDTLSRLFFVLMNATYFKANWASPFDKGRTDPIGSKSQFTQADGTTTPVQMMRKRLWGYTETANAQVMEIPYVGDTASMYVVLPTHGKLQDALDGDSGLLSPQFWTMITSHNATPLRQAEFSMPKFSFSYDGVLNDSLKTLGLQTTFTDQADFRQMGSPDAKVSLVKQDTFIKVDEDGTEAAAVTVIGGVAEALPQNVGVMTVDHPFLVSIVEKKTGSVLFLGVVTSPSFQP